MTKQENKSYKIIKKTKIRVKRTSDWRTPTDQIRFEVT